MRIGVIGAGAMGGLFAVRLAAAGEDVCLIEVNPAQIAAVNSDGLRLSMAERDEVHVLPIGPAASYSGSFDLLIVFTKGMHTQAAMQAASHLVGPQTIALTVQNGLGNVEAIETVVPRQRIVRGMTNWPATAVAAGHVRVPGSGEVHLWPAEGPASPRFEEICEIFGKAGLNCLADPAVDVAIWEKVAFNAALNSVAALTGMTVGEMDVSAEARSIVFSILGEALAVASALGVKVDRERTRQSVEYALENHRHHKPSMLQDRLAGRPMEIDTITGAVVREGARVGVVTPVTATVADILSIIAADHHRSTTGHA
jgi:2-dehydropantoate 2-reductase